MRLIERDEIGSDGRKSTSLNSSSDSDIVVAEAVRAERVLLEHLVQNSDRFFLVSILLRHVFSFVFEINLKIFLKVIIVQVISI